MKRSSNYFFEACLIGTDVCYERPNFVANILLQNVIHNSEANMTGFIVVCEDRAEINETCRYTMTFDISEFEWTVWPNNSRIIRLKKHTFYERYLNGRNKKIVDDL